MASRDIIVIGASTGGIEALRLLVSDLPKDFRASLFVVLHSGPGAPGILHEILDRSGSLEAISPHDKERFRPGKIYVAPPDWHLLLEPGVIRLTKGPRENRFRPAIDPLFRSAAQVYGPRAIGVILTGGLDDGTAGLWALKKLGGVAVVQDPNDAIVPSMPRHALQHVSVDYCVPLIEIAPLLVKLTTAPVEEKVGYEVPKHLDLEIKIAKQDPAIEHAIRQLWEKSSYTCPECHGVLLQHKEGSHERFRCHTGHAFTTDVLLASVTEAVEESLWSTVRSIEESVMLMSHMAKHLKEHDPSTAAEFLKKAQEADRRSKLVREALAAHEDLNAERIEEEAKS